VGLARLSRRRPTERYPALAPAPLGLEGVKDDRGGVHLLGARSLSPLVGCVERTTDAGGSLTVWGWAVDWRHAGRPPTVAVFAGGRCLERVEPWIERPDVTKVLRLERPWLARLGIRRSAGARAYPASFVVVLPLGLLRAPAPTPIRVIAIARDGVASELEYLSALPAAAC